MKLNSLFLSIVTFLLFQIGNSQVISCFEIESILVDACAPSGAEGQNEMVRFKVGPNALNTSNLSVGWATVANSWDGVCQDASTALKVSQLNQTIQSCGILIEPTGGVLPANSKVILITGINFDVPSNSFAGLSDSVYVLFHCSASSSGNFANGGTGIRTLNMDFAVPSSCSDQVSYDRSLLVGGDGSTVNFGLDGTASYINNGCIAPFTPLDANWITPGVVCQSSSPIDLNTFVIGTSGGVWSGEGVSNGIFDPANLSGDFEIEYAVGEGACIVTSSQTIQVSLAGNASFSNPGTICSTNPIIQLNDLLSGDLGGIWSGNGVNGSQFDPSNLSGNFTLIYTIGLGSCSSSVQQTFEVLSIPEPIITGTTNFCNNETPSLLTASLIAGATANWFSDSTLSVIINNTDTYLPSTSSNLILYVTQQVGACESNPTVVNINFYQIPPIPSIISPVMYCDGASLPLLTSTSQYNVFWYTDSLLLNQVGSGPTYQPGLSGPNSYWLNALDGTCYSNAVEMILLPQESVIAEISLNGSNVVCGNNSVQLVSSSQTNNQWSTNESSESIFVNQAGNYTLTVTGACNTDSSSIEVIDGQVLANFAASVETGVEPLSVIFNDASEFADTCQWFVNGLLSSISPDVPQTYAMGTYSIMLICSNAFGCSDTLTRTIDVLSNKTELPNTFSPNGDGKNDILLFTLKGIVEYDVVLFNRWGNKVAEWDNNSSGWDGLSNGRVSPEGVYFYILRAFDLSNNLSEYKGSITLVR